MLDILDKSELFWYAKRGYQEGRMAALWGSRQPLGRSTSWVVWRSSKSVMEGSRDESSLRCYFEVANPQAAEGE